MKLKKNFRKILFITLGEYTVCIYTVYGSIAEYLVCEFHGIKFMLDFKGTSYIFKHF